MTVTRKNRGWSKQIKARVAPLEKQVASAGFPKGSGADAPFYTTKRADGSVIAGPSRLDVTVWNNEGATINHPGGQPFYKNKNGEIVYVSKSNPRAGRMAKTKPHTITIPARRFMDLAAHSMEVGIKAIQADYIKRLIEGTGESAEEILHILGAFAQGEIVFAIDNIPGPPNAPSTIAKKSSSKPLIDTGAMKGAVTVNPFEPMDAFVFYHEYSNATAYGKPLTQLGLKVIRQCCDEAGRLLSDDANFYRRITESFECL